MSALAFERTFLLERAETSERFFPANAEAIARLCQRMSERFLAGGRLLAFGTSASARSDVRHVAVEFVHPVIVGKRALPALGLTDSSELLAARQAGRHRDGVRGRRFARGIA